MGPGSGCRWSTGSSRCTTARLKCNPLLVAGRRSRCCSRERSRRAMQNSKFKIQNWNARPRVPLAFCILHFALLVLVTGCGSKARADVIPEGPPLAVPNAPAHQIAVEQVAEAPAPEPPPAPEPASPAPRPVVTNPPPRPRTETPPAQPAAAPPPETPTVRVAPATTTSDR